MRWLLNVVYVLTLVPLGPWLLWRSIRTGRYRRGLAPKLLGLRQPLPPGAVWFHGVSVGEIHLLRRRGEGQQGSRQQQGGGSRLGKRDFCHGSNIPCDYFFAVKLL